MSYNPNQVPPVMYRKFLLGLLSKETEELIIKNSTLNEQRTMFLAALQQIFDDYLAARLSTAEYKNFFLLIIAEWFDKVPAHFWFSYKPKALYFN